MPRLLRTLVVVSTAIVLAAPAGRATTRLTPRQAPAEAATPAVDAEALARLPMAFEANRGQTDASVRYVARGRGYSVFLTAGEAVLGLSGPSGAARDVVRMRFVGANANARIIGEGPLEGRANYMAGADRTQWRTDVETFAKVRYEGIYPGVDAVYYGNQSELEYDFVVRPGADVGAIRFEIAGADRVRADESGDLVLTVGGRELRQRRPVVYQSTKDGGRVAVACRYAVDGGGRVGFDVGGHDPSLPLVVDPVLTYGTFVGGYAGTAPAINAGGSVVAVDASSAIYIAGGTRAADFPIAGAVQAENSGEFDVFVTKLSPAGAIVYSTYLGGVYVDTPTGIAVDASGSACIVGSTLSPDFPTANALFGHFNASGFYDAFVAKLSPTGDTLVYSTFLGGSSGDSASDVALDASGNVYVCGGTSSQNFPTVNPLSTGNGTSDGFVAKLSASGGSLVYSTYLGGADDSDSASSIAVNASGNAYVVGRTSAFDFPTVSPLFGDPNGFGDDDAFVSKLSPAGNSLVYSTYLGGAVDEGASAVAIDATGAAYVTGYTTSTNFPTLNPLFGDTNGFGFQDAFVTKLTPAGNAIAYSTYLGGANSEGSSGIAVDAAGNAYVSGGTPSTNFPTVSPLFGDANGFGSNDAFVAKLTPSGSSLVYSTYLGGSQFDGASDIALDSSGRAVVIGGTSSTDFPTVNPLFGDTDGFSGFSDPYVTRLSASGNAIDFSTYINGTRTLASDEAGSAIAVDAAGSAYITGYTTAIDFPTQNGPSAGAAHSGGRDAYVTKLSPSGRSVVYSTYLGGALEDVGRGIAVDGSGSACVVGYTASTNFPTASPLFGDTDGFGSHDAFVTRLTPAGNGLVFSTYLGGSTAEQAYCVAVDSSGFVYVGGYVDSTNFPAVNPLLGDTNGFGGPDGFVTKLSSSGTTIVYSTYFGGSIDDRVLGIAADAEGNAYITGYTASADLPTAGPLFGDTNGFGLGDAFVAKLPPFGGTLVYSTYLGASGSDLANAIALDSAGSAYVAGLTDSTNFPTVNPIGGDTNGFGGNDAFVTKLSPAGNAIAFSTYLGGSGDDYGFGIAVDGAGAHVAGYTVSTDFPTVDPVVPDANGFGDEDAFVATVRPETGTLVFSSYLGGFRHDRAYGVAVGGDGGVYVVGYALSSDFPTASGYDETLSAYVDAFVVKIGGACLGGDTVGLHATGGNTFFLRECNAPGVADVVTTFGPSGVVSIRGDWNGDGVDTVGIYAPATGCFFLRDTNTPGPADTVICFGAPGAVPITGDWDGDGDDTIGIYIAATATFFLRNENAPGGADVAFTYGGPNLVPIVGDWDGNGTTTVGLYSSGTGAFFLRNANTPGPADLTFTFGAGGTAVPLAGNWDGEGGDTIGLYVPGTSVFFLKNANAAGAADVVFQFGAPAGFTPLAGNWNGL